jgi:predicted regulator of Ras-like GTPase activity (Roadblock/LC7/MglB family)
MTQTVYSCAFKSVVNEVKNSNPQVLSMFVFDNEGQLLAQDDSAKEQTIQEVMSASTAIIDNSVSIGNLECISVSASSNQVSLICAGNFCFMTVYQKGGDEKFLRSTVSN